MEFFAAREEIAPWTPMNTQRKPCVDKGACDEAPKVRRSASAVPYSALGASVVLLVGGSAALSNMLLPLAQRFL
jgi:hypothetical protein